MWIIVLPTLTEILERGEQGGERYWKSHTLVPECARVSTLKLSEKCNLSSAAFYRIFEESFIAKSVDVTGSDKRRKMREGIGMSVRRESVF